MNPSPRPSFASLSGAPLLAAIAALSASGLFAQTTDVLKASNGDALDLTTSWTGGVVPGTGNIAVWNGSGTSTSTGTGISVAGVRFDSALTGNVTVTGAYNGTTVSCASGVITLASHGLANGTPIYISGNAPTGLANSTGYFVVNATANTFQVASTLGGTAIAFTGTSSTTTIRGGGGSLAIGSGGLNFAGAPAARGATFANYTNLSANQTWTLGGTADVIQLSHTGIITGTGSLTVDGSSLGILGLQAPNTFSGALVLNPGGSIKIGGAVTATANTTIIASALGTGSFVINGGKIFGGTDTGSSNITINGNFTVNSGASTNAVNGRLGLGGPIQLGGAERTVTLGRTLATPSLLITGNSTTSGANSTIRLIALTNGPATTIGNGTLRLNAEQSAIDGNLWVGVGLQGATTYTNNAGLTLGNRIITVTGTSSHFASGAGSPTLTVETGAVFNTSDGSINTRSSQLAGLNGGGVVTNLDTDGGGTTAISAITLGNNNTSGNFTGRILDGAVANTDLGLGLTIPADSTVSITKTGTGTQLLLGANKYSGNTTIGTTSASGGKLVTTTASDNTAGAYVVNNASTLGVRIHQAGASLKMAGLSLGTGTGNTTLELDLSTFGNPTAPLINNLGALTVNGNCTVNVIGSSGLLTPGTYTLVSSTSRLGTGNVTLGSLPVGVTATLAESSGTVTLSITNVTLNYAWTGATNSTWNTNAANTNWTLGGGASAYSDAVSRDVVLDDTATGPVAIDLPVTVTPKSVSVTAASKAYSISGAGHIGGTGGLTKSGASTLTLGTVNTYSGGTIVNDGTLSVTGTLPDTGSVTVNGGTATYSVDADDTVGALTLTSGTVAGSATLSPTSVTAALGTISAKLAGSGAVTKTGTGNLTLSGNNSYTGLTTVNGGNLTITDANALGSTAAGTVMGNATSIILADGLTSAAEPITITGMGNGQRGVIRSNGNATWTGNVIVDSSNGETRLGSSLVSGGVLTISGAITGGNASLITPSTAGYRTTVAVRNNSTLETVVLSGAGTFSGDVALWVGKLRLSGGDNRLPVTAHFLAQSFITGGANELDLNGTNQQFAGIADADPTINSGSLTTITNKSLVASVLTLSHSDDTTYSGPVTGNLSVVKAGSGVATLVGQTSYTGDTTVNGGTLVLSNTGLADGADVRISGGKLGLNFSGTDTVRSLYISGVLQPAGVYGPTGSGAANINDSVFSGTGTLTVTTGAITDPFVSWASSFGLTGANAAVTADPDGDGIPNLLEWILGGNPTVSDAATRAPQVSKDATYLKLTFNRADESEASTTLVARWSTNLTTWTDVAIGAASSGPDANGVLVSVAENGSSPDTVTVSVPLTNASAGRLFIALRATKN